MMMNAATQSIDELIATNPDAIGNMSDEELNKLIDGAPLPNGETASEASPDPAKKEDAEVVNTEVDESKAEGILTKDGKHIIPNSVLVAARETAAQAEARALAESKARQEAEAKVAALELQLNSLSTGNQEIDTSGFYGEEELSVLREDMPEVAEIIKAQQEKIIAQSIQLKKQGENIALTEQEVWQRNVQEAIDSVPLLALLQATDKPAFDKAVMIDNILQNDPEFKDLSLKDRFEKVAERYELAYGKPSSSKQDTNEVVTKALEKANKETSPPASIADIGGGAMPAVNEDLATAGKSPGELADMFAKMTPAQMDAYLSRVIQ